MSKNSEKLDPRIIRTRQLLRSAIVSLIPGKGFASITVQDIADRATLNRATFYLHYRDKKDLLMDAFEELMAQVAPLPPDSGLLSSQPAQEAVEAVFHHVARHADFFRVMLAEENVPEFSARIREYIEEVGLQWLTALQPEEEKTLVRREIAINYIGSAFLGVLVWWLQHERPYPVEFMTSQLLHMTVFGLHRSLGLPEIAGTL